MQPISDLLEKAIRRLPSVKKIKGQMLIDAWPEAVGGKIAERTDAEKFEDGTLHIRVNDSVWAQHLSLQKKQIITRLNRTVKTNILKDIRFRIGVKSAEKKTEENSQDGNHWRKQKLTRHELQKIETAFSGVTLPDDLADMLRRYFVNQRKKRIWFFEQGFVPCQNCGMPVDPEKGQDGCFCCISLNNG